MVRSPLLFKSPKIDLSSESATIRFLSMQQGFSPQSTDHPVHFANN